MLQLKPKIIEFFVLIASVLSFQTFALEIVGGGRHSAEKLISDWSRSKPNNGKALLKFSDSIFSSDLTMLQKRRIDFAIVDAPLSETELAKMSLLQFPFALNGVSIVVNLPGNLSGILKLDSPTIAKIFAGEISYWNNPAITALNPKHDLPHQEIVIIHSGDASKDYPVLNSYLRKFNEKWKAGEASETGRVWPANAVFKLSMTDRYNAIKSTPYSISFTPMIFSKHSALSPIQIKNKDGNFVKLSDTSLIATASTINIEDASPENLSLIDRSGGNSWPISNFSFIVVNKDSVKEEKIVQLLNIISFGLKFGSVKPMLYDYIAIPDTASKVFASRMEAYASSGNKRQLVENLAEQETPESVQRKKNNNKRSNEENAILKREARLREEEIALRNLSQQTEARAAAIELTRLNEIRKIEDAARARFAKNLADDIAREDAIKTVKPTKVAAEEPALKARKKEAADREREIELRHQKDEDPIAAYRRSLASGGDGR